MQLVFQVAKNHNVVKCNWVRWLEVELSVDTGAVDRQGGYWEMKR